MNKKFHQYFCTFLLVINLPSDSQSCRCIKPQSCPATQEWNRCPLRCKLTCENYVRSRIVRCATTPCQPQCACPSGYVLRSEDSTECISPEHCECEGDLVLKECGTQCEATCNNPIIEICVEVCLENVCQCPVNTVRLSEGSSTCVKVENCKKCKGDLLMVPCASPCQATCDNPVIDVCVASCELNGCRCPEKKVRKTLDDTSCVDVKECP